MEPNEKWNTGMPKETVESVNFPEQHPDDLASATPPGTGKPHLLQEDNLAVYGFSIAGSSHDVSGACCQDYNDFVFLPDAKLIIAAIADGVGSCRLSHWGAYTSVRTAIASLRQKLEEQSGGKPLAVEQIANMEELFNIAFTDAMHAVEDFADAHQQSVFQLQSTLTVAVYDGRHMACCHVGDDGIVAEGVSGKYMMVTSRMKGELANSVVTLQSGQWRTTIISTDVAAFVMSTDGVLDSYVGNAGVNNRVYYPFFWKLVYRLQQKDAESPHETVCRACKCSMTMLRDPQYRKAMTDDTTVVVVARLDLLNRETRPVFSQQAWDEETERIRQEREKRLFPGKSAAPEPVRQPDESKPQEAHLPSQSDLLRRSERAMQPESHRFASGTVSEPTENPRSRPTPQVTIDLSSPTLLEQIKPGLDTLYNKSKSTIQSAWEDAEALFERKNAEYQRVCTHCRLRYPDSDNTHFCRKCGAPLVRRMKQGRR